MKVKPVVAAITELFLETGEVVYVEALAERLGVTRAQARRRAAAVYYDSNGNRRPDAPIVEYACIVRSERPRWAPSIHHLRALILEARDAKVGPEES